MKKFSVNKIGGAGLMLPYQKLLEWVRYVVKNVDPDTQVIIVVSAFAKVTRMLQEIFEKKLNGETEKASALFESIKKIHLQRCKDLFVEDTTTLYEYFHNIEYFIKDGSINNMDNPTTSNAYILKFGELMSSEIFHQFLLEIKLSVKLIDAQQMIFAEGEDYCNSIPLQPETSESISKAIDSKSEYTIILTQGYICNHRLLGLDGSDLTASLIASGLKLYNPNYDIKSAFWKDVKGVMVNGVVKEEMNGDEYDSLETVPVRKDAIATNVSNQIETCIRSFENLEHQGTRITW